jgi:hypothetical protein
MRIFAALLFALAMAIACFDGVSAGEKKEVTIKGSITCAKCDLGQEKACTTVIVEKKGDKKIVYYFDKATHKKYHSDICTAAKDGTVTGVVSKMGDKNLITVKKLEYK